MVVKELIAKLGFKVDTASVQSVNSSINNAKGKLGEMGTAATAASSEVSGGLNAIARLSTWTTGIFIGMGMEIVNVFRSIVSGTREASDEMNSLDGRLRIVTETDKERLNLERELYATAQNSRQDLGATGDLYFKIAKSAKELGVDSRQALDITETVTKALTVGGATTQQTTATILQLGQALSSGKLQGDELRSLDENAFDLMQAMAEYFGTTIGNLKQMGAQGQLTAEQVAKGILYAKTKIDDQFGKMPLTIGQALQVAENTYKQGIYEFERITGMFQGVAHGIVSFVTGISHSIQKLSDAIGGPRNLIKLLTISLASLAATLAAVRFDAIIAGVNALFKAIAANVLVVGKFMAILAIFVLIGLAIQDIYTWIQGGDSLMGRWLGPWEEFKAKLGPIIELVQAVRSAAEELAAIIIAKWQEIKPSVDQLGSAILQLWSVIGPIIMQIAEIIGGVLVGSILYAMQMIGALIQYVSDFLSNNPAIADAIVATFEGAFTLIKDAIQVVAAVFSGNWSQAINNVKQLFSDLGSFAIRIMQDIASAIGTYIMDKITGAKTAIMDFLGWSGQQTSNAVNDSRSTYNITANQTNYGSAAVAAASEGVPLPWSPT